MTVAAAHTSAQIVGGSTDEPPGRWDRIRRSAAYFWVGFLMLGTLERRPWLVRVTRPFFLWFTWRTARVMRENLMLNARRILGESSSPAERRAHSKRVLRHFFDFITELGRTPHLSDTQLQSKVAFTEGREGYGRARALKRGAIIVTAHLGSYELGIASLRQIEQRVHVVFRRDSMERFERLRTSLHHRLGVVEATIDDGLHVWMSLRDALANDEVVLMQGDRVMPDQKGERIAFLGGHMLFPSGPVKLSLATGAPIIPVFSVREANGHVRVCIEEPIVPEPQPPGATGPHPALLRIAAVIEGFVKRYPDQWLRVQRAFCEDIDAAAADAHRAKRGSPAESPR